MQPRSEEARTAVRYGHVRTTTATLHHAGAGAVGELPVHSGSVIASMSDRVGPRSGAIEVPGYAWFDLASPHRAAYVHVTQTIGSETWDLGQFPVQAVTEERPGGMVTLRLEDWAGRRNRSQSRIAQKMPTGATVAAFFAHYMAVTMPGGAYSVVQDDTGGAAKPYIPELSPGSSVWDAMRDLADAVGAVLVPHTYSTGSVRIFDPYQPVHEDITGTVNRSVIGVDLDRLVNSVTYHLTGEGGAKFRGGPLDIADGPWKFDRDGAGYATLVERDSVATATQAIANSRARKLYDRRAGAVRTIDVRVVPQPWLEIGDILSWSLDGDRAERFSADTIIYPLRADDAMRIIAREVPVR